ncbi:TlpA family protein disulfide reductase [Salegentibacter salegens]|uniref:Thiol-disulfide isomerase or thioredoxin n=1 Tax=Salegentibacter salegens TaxID=143223 RepID=A0A1M7JG00_9FLAO|nr:redoxin domain-containing protein [Salegentibacter salegens]PRX42903.1 thiol-disulfide isomerase/thioredoxin [Salegentibacter salegens]SHM51886.1 Thiol-disulfide isomerase or thioredoxin [Salegentibacter salegens]
MKRLLLLFFIIFGLNIQAQTEKSDKLYFSDALVMHLPKYNQEAKAAYRHRQFEEADRLFENFVTTKLKGTYIDNFKFLNLKEKEVALYDYKKPVYLLTYASWCIPGKGEIPALNELADKYRDKIDFVILFWDKKETARKLSKQFNSHINVLYVDETRNNHSYVVENLKHSLGLPTCYLIAGDREIMDIKRSIFYPYNLSKEKSFELNYEAINSAITNNLIGNSKNKEPVKWSAIAPD